MKKRNRTPRPFPDIELSVIPSNPSNHFHNPTKQFLRQAPPPPASEMSENYITLR